ncbi:MAG: signal peptidase I [Polyangiaceae bacterium]|nr:signal peptidase I [Polyangiaceae bacterium]
MEATPSARGKATSASKSKAKGRASAPKETSGSDPDEPDAARGDSSSEPPAEGGRISPSTPGGPAVTNSRTNSNPLLRYGFYLFWLVGLPLLLAIFTVWIATRNADGGPVGVLPAIIIDQKIPAGILFFTAFAIILWRFRHDLPLSAAAGVGGRRDVPTKLRGRFEEAGALLEEARRILRTRKRDVEKELTSAEREDLTKGLDDLEHSMNTEPFAPALFEKAHSRAERLVGEHLSRWRKGEIREYAESIAIAVGVALLLRVFVIEAFKIPSSSMVPTLMVGDHIFVNKFKYGPLLPLTDKRLFSDLPPARGDVIVFKYPQNMEQDFIKRVIAIPGDHLEVVDGRPIINGWVVPHCHVGTFIQDEGGKDGILGRKEAELYIEYLHDRAYFTLHQKPPSDVTCTSHKDCVGEGQSCYTGICGSTHSEYDAKPGEVWVLGDNRDNSHDSRAWNDGRGGGVPFDNIKGRAMVVFITFGPSQNILERLLVDVMGRPRLPASNAHLQTALDKCLREVPKQTVPPAP